ncbi:MAG: hypothetical protein QOE86_69 [Solirubrobacteraceae bacterium]|nr:hypothetical protein [Solirubrobacteraceae bacterium]
MTFRRAARTPQHTAGPEQQVLRLQQAVGNRGLGRMLARQPVDDVEILDDLLDATQVTKAIRFYTAQPDRYPADIMLQIQAAVGAGETGVADEETVQAVARWQAADGSNDPALKVDGMAGPRTLPRMFTSGLNAAGEAAAFGEEAQTGVIDQWQGLTPTERATELVRLVNDHLTTAGVPAVVANPKDTGNDAGAFDFATWQMEIGLPALSQDQLTRDQAADIVDTIYHEARHAEQWFRMAQLRAGQGRTGAQITTELGIPANIAAAAVAAPLDPGSMRALIAQGWYDSVYGSGSDARNRTLQEVEDADTARKAAAKRFKANPTAANQTALNAAVERFHRAHDAYRNLPEENDAWATGPQTGAGVTHGSPPPPPPPPSGPSAAALLRSLGGLTGTST